jgi:hypothetical protein
VPFRKEMSGKLSENGMTGGNSRTAGFGGAAET